MSLWDKHHVCGILLQVIRLATHLQAFPLKFARLLCQFEFVGRFALVVME